VIKACVPSFAELCADREGLERADQRVSPRRALPDEAAGRRRAVPAPRTRGNYGEIRYKAWWIEEADAPAEPDSEQGSVVTWTQG